MERAVTLLLSQWTAALLAVLHFLIVLAMVLIMAGLILAALVILYAALTSRP